MIEQRSLWSNVPLLVVEAPDLAAQMLPGQFALVRDPTTFDPYLRHPAWLYETKHTYVAFTQTPRDAVAERGREGSWIDLLAPLGHPVEIPRTARRILLIGLGADAAPLVAVGHAALDAHPDREIVFVCQAAGHTDPLPVHLIRPEIEYHVAKDAPTEDWLDDDLILWAETIVANGSNELYYALRSKIRRRRLSLESGLAQICIHVEMPCGTGECYACAVSTSRGIRLACSDGPWFDLAEWEGPSRK